METEQTLADFLLARYDEEEEEISRLREFYVNRPDALKGLEGDKHGYELSRENDISIGVGRVLAEVEAKRRIVELHSPVGVYDWRPNGECPTCSGADSDPHWSAVVDFPCPTMRILASVYADHPDCREEWRA